MLKIERRPTAPGVLLSEHYLKPRGITVTRFAEIIGCSRKHMSALVNAKTRLEPEMAGKLAKTLGTSVQMWINLQAGVDAYDAEKAVQDWRPAHAVPEAAE